MTGSDALVTDPPDPPEVPEVAEALAAVDELQQRPLGEHVDRFESAHAALRRALDAAPAS